MIGVLNPDQIDQVLQMQVYGRLACQAAKRLYIVPVSYAYDGKHLYMQSKEGMKVQMLRKNPQVCFQADIVDSLTNWRSVVIWGSYEELTKSAEQINARRILENRFTPLHTSASISLPVSSERPPQIVEKRQRAVYFRIKVVEKTGRFEKPEVIS